MSDRPFDAIRIGQVGLSNIPAGLWTMLRGDPQAQTTLGRYIPGGVQGMVGGMGGLAVDTANLVGEYTGLKPFETPEFIKTAQEHHQRAAEQANADMPTMLQPMEPENAYERVAGDVSRSVAEAGFMPPVKTALRYAPGAIRGAVTALAPAATHPLGVGGPIAGITGAVSTYRNANAPDVGGPRVVLPPDEQSVSTPTPTIPQPGASEPRVVLPPEDVAQEPRVVLPPEVDAQGQVIPNVTPHVPDVGETGTKKGEVLLTLGGILLAAATRGRVGAAWNKVTETKKFAEYKAQREEVGLEIADQNTPKPSGYDPATQPPPRVVQLPGVSQGTLAKTALVDQDAHIMEALGAYAEMNNDNAKFVKRTFGQINDRLTAQNRQREWYETGMDPITKTELPSVGRYMRRLGALDKEVQTKIDSTVKRLDQIDDRDGMMREAIKGGKPPPNIDDTELRTGMWEIPTTQLKAEIAANMRDPVVRAFVDERRTIHEAYLQHAVDRGLISQATHDNLIALRPNHLSRVDPNGRILQLLGERDISTRGSPNISGNKNSAHVMEAQLTQLMRAIELNDRDRLVVETFLNGQNADPRQPIVVTELPERLALGAVPRDEQRNILNVGFGTDQRSFQFHNPIIYEHLTRGNDMLGIYAQGAAHATQMLQSFTTGAGAMLGGKFFGLGTNLPRAIMTGATQRPKGMAGGLVDKALQSATGGKVGLRVPEPTMVLGAGYELAAGSMAMLGKGIANILERDVNPGARLVRALLGPSGTRALADRLNTAYMSSNLSQARGEGAAGSGQGAGLGKRVDVLQNNMPASLRPRLIGESLKQPYSPGMSNVPELYYGKGTTFAVRARSLINDINNLMNDAYHLHVRRINPNMQPMERAYEINQLTGAPGRTGESRMVRQAGVNIPYLNPSIQGVSRALQSYREAPFGTAVGKAITYGFAKYAQLWLVLQGGPVALDMWNRMTDRQQTDNIVLPFGDDPMNHVRISPPQEDRWILPIVHELADTVLKIVGGAALLETLTHYYHAFTTEKAARSIEYGVTQLADPLIQAPTAVQMFANAAGFRYRGDIQGILDNIRHGGNLESLVKSQTSSIQEQMHLPGQDTSVGGDHGVGGAVMSTFLGATMGTLAQMAGEMEHVHSFNDFWNRMGDVWQHRFRQQNPIGGGVLWPAANTVPARGLPEQQYYRHTVDALANTKGLEEGEKNLGLTRAGGPEIAVRGEPQLSNDPGMRLLLKEATALRNYLERTTQKETNDLDKLRQSVPHMPSSQDEKRKLLNDYAREIQDVYARAQQVIDKANEQATALIGTTVDFAKKIDWSKGIEQFEEGAPPTAGPRVMLPP